MRWKRWENPVAGTRIICKRDKHGNNKKGDCERWWGERVEGGCPGIYLLPLIPNNRDISYSHSPRYLITSANSTTAKINKFRDFFVLGFFFVICSHITLLPETVNVLLESLFWLRQTSLKITHRHVLTLWTSRRCIRETSLHPATGIFCKGVSMSFTVYRKTRHVYVALLPCREETSRGWFSAENEVLE